MWGKEKGKEERKRTDVHETWKKYEKKNVSEYDLWDLKM